MRYEPKKWHKLCYELTPDFNLLWTKTNSNQPNYFFFIHEHSPKALPFTLYMYKPNTVHCAVYLFIPYVLVLNQRILGLQA